MERHGDGGQIMKSQFSSIMLSEIASIYSGFAFKSNDLSKDGIPVIKIANIQNKKVQKHCNDFLPENLCNQKFQKYFLNEDDVLIAMTGAGSVGKMGKMRRVDRKYLVNQRVAIVRTNPQIADPEYVYQTLSDDSYEKILYGLGLGAGQPNVSPSEIGSLDIPFPPLPTQHKIAAILSAYDNLIENNTRRIQILEEMAQALYREWFVEFRFPGHEKVKMVESELGMVPEEWEVKKLGELYRTSSGGTPSRKIAEYYGGTINWVKTKELNDNFLFKTEEKITDVGLQKSSAKIFPENTVIMAMYGATIGKLAILSQPAATNQACCAIIKIDDLFQHHYIFSFLLVNREKIFSLGAGAAQQNISQTVIQKMKILKPSDKIMKMFTEFVAPNFEHIKLLQLKNDNLRSTRDMLLPNLISGEVGVDNFNINIGRNR